MRIPWLFPNTKEKFPRIPEVFHIFPQSRHTVFLFSMISRLRFTSFSRFSAEIRDTKNRRRFHSSDETRCQCVLVRAWYIYWSCGIKRLRVALWERRWKRWRSTSACRLKRFSISARAFDAHYQAFLFYSGARYIHNPFRSNGTPMPRLEPPAFLICLGHIVVLRLTKSRWQDSIN